MNHIIVDIVIQDSSSSRFLSNPEQRETFESAHSVVLSILANNGGQSSWETKSNRTRLASRLVPFYLKSLQEVSKISIYGREVPISSGWMIQNSDERNLSTEQFRLAYHSLVRSASSSHDDASAWLCVEALLGALQGSGDAVKREKYKRLALTLVSLISAVNLPLLKPILAAVETELLFKNKNADHAHRKEMVKEVHDQIFGHVGDAQKEVALKWWVDLRERLNFQMEGSS